MIKRVFAFASTMVVIGACLTPAFAQEGKMGDKKMEGKMMGHGKMGGKMMAHGKMKGKMAKGKMGHGMMGGKMHSKMMKGKMSGKMAPKHDAMKKEGGKM